jgi:CheY-like chemotaxis protein
MTSETPPRLLLVADDLMFPSRVREALRPLYGTVKVAATETAAIDAARSEPAPDAVLVNLNARRYDPLAVIRAMKGDDRTRVLPLLAFAGHVEAEKHEAARAAGADLVAANSSVALHLPKLLERLQRIAAGTENAPDPENVLEIEEDAA